LVSRKRQALFHSDFLDDLRYWIETDRKIALRILELVDAVLRDPFRGLGKPEPLGGDLKGSWSRRISAEHRMVYDVTHDLVAFVQARFHYKR
jgi:toxin YoeB